MIYNSLTRPFVVFDVKGKLKYSRLNGVKKCF